MLVAAAVLACLAVFLFAVTDDFLMRALLGRLKRTIRPVRPALALSFFVLLLAAEVWWFRRIGLPGELATPLLVLSAYFPLTYFVYCNVLIVGPRREALWATLSLLACVLSLHRFGRLRLEWILPFGLGLTVLFCWRATRDPYTHYLRGLWHVYFGKDIAAARAAFARAHALDPAEPRYRYHLGRAELLSGDDGGRARLDAMTPEELARVRSDPTLLPDWEI